MVRPIKTLLLNEFRREAFEYSVGHYYYFIISRGKVDIGYKCRIYIYINIGYKLLKYNYFYFLNQKNLESAGLKTKILKNSGLTAFTVVSTSGSHQLLRDALLKFCFVAFFSFPRSLPAQNFLGWYVFVSNVTVF